MNRALRICRAVGCAALVVSGYCDKHKKKESDDIRERWKNQDAKKTPEQRKFYQSARWTACSRTHRQIEPLCRRCKAAGKVVAGALVHHNPARDVLVASGLSPFDDKFLETLCFNCHQKELKNVTAS